MERAASLLQEGIVWLKMETCSFKIENDNVRRGREKGSFVCLLLGLYPLTLMSCGILAFIKRAAYMRSKRILLSLVQEEHHNS